DVAPSNGPFVGGNIVAVTNAVPAIGASDITNVLVGGVSASGITGQGTNWVAFIAPATGSAEAKDIVMQSATLGDATLVGAYTYHAQGAIGGMVVNGYAWTNMAQGFDAPVRAVHKTSSGTLLAGGYFTNVVNGPLVNRIAQWDGVNWTNMDSGFQGKVWMIEDSPDGTIYAGGEFNYTGITNLTYKLAKWDGTHWTNVGGGFNSTVYSMAFDANSNAYVGGGFTASSSHNVGRVARWDGANWTNIFLQSGTNSYGFNNGVYAIARGTNGMMYFGGNFTNAVTPSGDVAVNHVAQFDGTNIMPMGNGFGGLITVNSLELDNNGVLYAGGSFFEFSGGYYMSRIAKWDGVNWTNVGEGLLDGTIQSLAFDDDNYLYAGGQFNRLFDGTVVSNLAVWNGLYWTNAGVGANSYVFDVALVSNQTMLAGGQFTTAGNVATNRVGLVYPLTAYDPGTHPSSGSWTGNYEVAIIAENDIGNGHDITNVTVCGVTATIKTQMVDRVWVTVAQSPSVGTGNVVVVSTSYGTTTGTNSFIYQNPVVSMLGTNGAAIANGDFPTLENGSKFAPVVFGSARTNTFAITNSGDYVLTITGVSTSGLGSAMFDLSGVPATVAVGGVSNFMVTYEPSAIGSHAASLVFESDDIHSPFIFNVAGSCFEATTNVGPYAGGNTITITNGYFGAITNVLLGAPSVGSALLVDSGSNWFTITLPAATNAGTVDLIVQAEEGDTTLANAYTYNPAGEIVADDWSQWEETDGLPMALIQPGCATLSNTLYCVGGYDDSISVITNAYAFDGTTWNAVAGLPTTVVQQAMVSMGGLLYSLGGCDGGFSLSNVWVYDGADWSAGVDLPIELKTHAASALDGSLYVLGGVQGAAGTVTHTNILRFNGSSWAWAGSVDQELNGAAAQTLSNLIWVVGSQVDSAVTTNCYSYDGVATSLSPVAGVDTGYCTWVTGLMNDRLYVAAGATETTGSTNAFYFDGVSWTEIPGLPEARMYAAGGVVNGAFYVAGGFDNSMGARTNVYRYPALGSGVFPESGSWTGSYTVTINGVNMGSGSDITNVTLCGIAAAILPGQSATQVVVLAGQALTPGVGDVVVYSTSYGETVKSNAFAYTGAGIQVHGSNFVLVALGSAVSNIFTVTNSGDEALLISAATNSGSGAGYFDVSAMPSEVAPGTASNFPVVFTP
ncbi:MAG: choice-of-anchor D domain-containing protein, partial [Kiritimatiellae bacterium]|nr:choice-of-anchor D domain-containing protein [Kiritimatiellia bacterium]